MGIGGGNVQFLDIAFLIGTGMLFVTESVEGRFSLSTGIAVFTRCGLAADLSFFIDFYGLALFAAGGLNMVASTTAADAFSTFRFFSVSWRLISSIIRTGCCLAPASCGSGIRCCNPGMLSSSKRQTG